MKSEVGDSLTVIAYHYPGYPFGNSYAGQRFSYYGIGGTPYMNFDGIWKIAGGSSNNYNQYRNAFNIRKNVEPEVEITLSGDYNQSNGQGWARARFKNTTSSALTGYAHFVICQRDTPYTWYWLDSLHHIERQMYPSAGGTYMTLDPDETKEINHNFTIPTSWLRDRCYLSVFYQKTSYEIANASEEDLVNLGVAEGENVTVDLFNIGPNPAKEFLFVNLTCNDATIEIIDCTGSVQNVTTAVRKNMKIPINNLSSGIYFCRVKTKERIETRKFIKF